MDEECVCNILDLVWVDYYKKQHHFMFLLKILKIKLNQINFRTAT
jgi:hypothetical protein